MGQLVVVSSVDELTTALRARRHALGLPLRVVGERIGMSPQQVWATENGVSQPGSQVLLRILGALNCDLALVEHYPGGAVIFRPDGAVIFR